MTLLELERKISQAHHHLMQTVDTLRTDRSDSAVDAVVTAKNLLDGACEEATMTYGDSNASASNDTLRWFLEAIVGSGGTRARAGN